MNQENIIPQLMAESLKTLAGVNKEDIVYTSRGLKFTFENSLRANFCQIINYHDNYLVEFRKRTDNLLEGKKNLLISEEIIKPQELQEHFENKTGIYLSFMGV